MNIPLELQAYILSKLDGASLARTKKVCTLWNDAVSKLETFGNIWMFCCFKEIPTDCLHQLLAFSSSTDGRAIGGRHTVDIPGSSEPWTFWRDVYAEYHRYKYVKGCCSWKFRCLDVFARDNQAATCVKLIENTLLLGYRNGYVSKCNIRDKEFAPLCLHGRQVTSLAIVKPEDRAVSPLVVSVSGGHDIQVSSLDGVQSQLNYHSKPVNCASAYHDRFVTGAGDSMVLGQPVYKAYSSSRVEREIVLHGHLADKTTCTGIWDNKVASGDEKGNILLWDLDNPDSPTHIGLFNTKIKWIHLRGKLLLWLTASGVLYISTDFVSYHGLDIYQQIQRKPESIALRGPLLAVGTKSGFVHLYYVETLDDWNNFDLHGADSVIKCEAEHVNAVDIGDDGTGPVISMATDEGVTLVQWQRQIPTNDSDDVRKLKNLSLIDLHSRDDVITKEDPLKS